MPTKRRGDESTGGPDEAQEVQTAGEGAAGAGEALTSSGSIGGAPPTAAPPSGPAQTMNPEELTEWRERLRQKYHSYSSATSRR